MYGIEILICVSGVLHRLLYLHKCRHASDLCPTEINPRVRPFVQLSSSTSCTCTVSARGSFYEIYPLPFFRGGQVCGQVRVPRSFTAGQTRRLRHASPCHGIGSVHYQQQTHFCAMVTYFLSRNVFLNYSKTRSLTSNRDVARFLNSEASGLGLRGMLLMRPFVCVLANVLGLNKGNIYNTSLFVQGGRQLQSYAIRNIFSRMFHMNGEVTISFATTGKLLRTFLSC